MRQFGISSRKFAKERNGFCLKWLPNVKWRNFLFVCLPLRKNPFSSPIPLRPVLGPWQRCVLGMGQWWRWMDSVRDPNFNPPGAQLPGPPGNSWFKPPWLQLHCGSHLFGPGQQTDKLQTASPPTVQHALPAGLSGAPGHPFGPRLLLPAVFRSLQHRTYS